MRLARTNNNAALAIYSQGNHMASERARTVLRARFARVQIKLGRCFFFFQARDGIRDGTVTGVQTCALPIWLDTRAAAPANRSNTPTRVDTSLGISTGGVSCDIPVSHPQQRTPSAGCPCPSLTQVHLRARSEERRVGKECRARTAPCDSKQME